MSNWETDWERKARRAREEVRRSEYEKMFRTVLWSICAAGVAIFAFYELQQHHFQVVIKSGDDDAPAIVQNSVNVPQLPQAQATPVPEPAANEESTPVQTVHPSPRRSVQEEYELASRIMESTRNEMQQRSDYANSGVMSNGVHVDQAALNDSWLASYENHCQSLGAGSVQHRQCRAGFKRQIMAQCQQIPERSQTAEQEAQCYAARAYEIVE